MITVVERKRTVISLGLFCILFLLSACAAKITHVPSKSLEEIRVSQPATIMVADIGDTRDEPSDRIGQGASYWLPLSYYARDAKGRKLPVSHYIASSLTEDLGKLGYITKLANDDGLRDAVTLEAAIDTAKKEKSDFLVTTKVTDGKTNYWGFIIIPFFQPVWTRIGYDVQLIDVNSGSNLTPLEMRHRETEWYFGKITIFDAIFDAGIFGRHWHQSAWGETVVSDALAETALRISNTLQSQKPANGNAGERVETPSRLVSTH